MVARRRMALVLIAVLAIALTATVVAMARARGAAKPKVTLVAYFPFNASHKPSVDLVKSMAQKFPGKVTVEAYDFTTQDGRQKWYKSGLQCAGVLINGKSDWDVIRNGKREKLSFQKREGILWTKDDLIAVIDQLIKDPTKPAVLTSKPASTAKPAAGDKAKPAEKPDAKPAAKPDAKPAPDKSK